MKRKNDVFTVCLTHDVDRVKKTYQYITKFVRNLFMGRFRIAFYHIFSIFSRTNPYWNFEKIVALEKKYRVKSTFFFLNESIRFILFRPKTWKLSLGRYNINNDKMKQVIRWLDKNGFEIGVHGSYNSYKDLNLLRKEKSELEKVIGHKIYGIRQHYLNLNEDTWQLQQKAGFRYDASFGFTRDVGFKQDIFHPFNPLNNKQFNVFPLVIMDFCLMEKKEPKKEYLKIIDLAQKKKAILVLNWHQEIFDEREHPGYAKVYEEIIIECKKKRGEFKILGEIFNEFN